MTKRETRGQTIRFVALLIAVKVNIIAAVLSFTAHSPTAGAFSLVAAALLAVAAILHKVGPRRTA